MKGVVVIGSTALGRQARCYPNGRASFWFSYNTTFGPNSAGGEETFSSQAEAVAYATAWVNEIRPTDTINELHEP